MQPTGWYPQPIGQLRYWDGQSWTQHVAPAGVQADTERAGFCPPSSWALYEDGQVQQRPVFRETAGPKSTTMSVTSFFSDDGVAVGALGHRRAWSPLMR
jgi:hypothetical protein